MTDLEISKALALAIGYSDADTGRTIQKVWTLSGELKIQVLRHVWQTFDYRDWNVISPIAERYNCFPKKMINEWAVLRYDQSAYANTPQKAIALAVIQGAKK